MFKPQPKPQKYKKVSKVHVWYTVMHEEIIPQFDRWGIRSCEINLHQCIGNRYLGFAHTKKRNNIHTPEELRRVVLACQPCHNIVEYMCIQYTGKTMTNYLEEIIQKREAKLKAQGIY